MDGPITGDEGVDVIVNVREKSLPEDIMVEEEEEEEEENLALAMRVGSDIVVMKPITCEAIVQKVEDMLVSKQPPFLERKRAKLQHRY
jgi:response regulator of citrate/malate metabolism